MNELLATIVDDDDDVREDLLVEATRLQLELQQKMGYDFTAMTIDEQIEYIKWNSVALASELSEALNEVGWKPWAASRYIDRERYVGEMIDVSKFFLNMLLVVGVTPQEFLQRFRGKTLVNHKRLEDGYDGTNKCPHCSRAQDEPHVVTS